MTAPAKDGAGVDFTAAGEQIALNAAMLRLFKGKYRDSGDRHSDALFVKEGLELCQSQLARALEDAERAKGRCGEVFVLLEIVEKYVQRSGHGVPIGIVANTVKGRQILSP